MQPEISSPKQLRYGPSEGYAARSQRRLQHDLGIGSAAAEMIINLRSQVVALQSQIYLLEVEQVARELNQQVRLAHYCEVYFEGTWIELDFEQDSA